jgi:hypothetical protein
MFTPRFMPCPSCGSSVDFAYADEHVCLSGQAKAEPETAQQETVQQETAQQETITSADVEAELHRYLETAAGRFESWLAALQVRAAG